MKNAPIRQDRRIPFPGVALKPAAPDVAAAAVDPAVHYATEPRPGNTVVAAVNGGVVGKKYLRREGPVVLKSLNPQYADIEVKETDQFEIKGVVPRIVEGAVWLLPNGFTCMLGARLSVQ